MVGETLDAICARPGAPSRGTVYNWLRRHPDFLARYRRMKAGLSEVMVQIACEELPYIGERESWVMLRRVVRETEARARRLSLKRYAPAAGPPKFTALLHDGEGPPTVIYGEAETEVGAGTVGAQVSRL